MRTLDSADPSSRVENQKQRRERLEGEYVAYRQTELYLNPLRGNYDAAHLRAVNHHLFQDLPGLGYSDVTPGIYRDPVAAGQDWIKHRRLESMNDGTFIAYSRMDLAAQKQLGAVLSNVDPKALGQLNKHDFTEAIARLYVELDYLHPFRDGNSRTLRAFTRQLAEEAGYTLEWDKFNVSPHSRDVLYIGRDLSVNEKAFPHIQDFNAKRAVQLTLDRFGQNPDLPSLLQDAIRPTRAIAFEKVPEAEALEDHPELRGAYDVLHAAQAVFTAKLSSEREETRQKMLTGVREHVQRRLDAGYTSGFSLPRQTEQDRDQGPRLRSDPGRDR